MIGKAPPPKDHTNLSITQLDRCKNEMYVIKSCGSCVSWHIFILLRTSILLPYYLDFITFTELSMINTSVPSLQLVMGRYWFPILSGLGFNTDNLLKCNISTENRLSINKRPSQLMNAIFHRKQWTTVPNQQIAAVNYINIDSDSWSTISSFHLNSTIVSCRYSTRAPNIGGFRHLRSQSVVNSESSFYWRWILSKSLSFGIKLWIALPQKSNDS